MAKKFNLAEFLADTGNVSDLDTMQIVRIPWDRIKTNELNFYAVDDVEDLRNSIQMQGLLDPITVTPDAEEGWYLLISGHRRHKAWGLLRQEDPEKYAEIPSIVRRFELPAMTELAMIMANSATRVLSSAEIGRQAERVERLFYELKEAGYEFPGRMRDQVAKACNVSASKIARLKLIREKLIPQWKFRWDHNELAEDPAYRLARLPEEFQFRLVRVLRKPTGDQLGRLADLYEQGARWENDLKCPDGHPCTHCDSALLHDSRCYPGERCRGKTCCLECRHAFGYGACSSACSKAVAKRKEAKEADEKKVQANRKRTVSRLLSEMETSAGRLVKALDAGEPMRDDECIVGWPRITAADVRKLARGEGADIAERLANHRDMLAPDMLTSDAVRKISELSGVSADWIMGLSDEMYPAAVSGSGTVPTDWKTGDPPGNGRYLCLVDMGGVGDVDLHEQRCDYADGTWTAYGRKIDDMFSVAAWYPLPPEWHHWMGVPGKGALAEEDDEQ